MSKLSEALESMATDQLVDLQTTVAKKLASRISKADVTVDSEGIATLTGTEGSGIMAEAFKKAKPSRKPKAAKKSKTSTKTTSGLVELGSLHIGTTFRFAKSKRYYELTKVSKTVACYSGMNGEYEAKLQTPVIIVKVS